MILSIVEKTSRGEICHAINRYATASNKYMKECGKNKESSYIMYLGAYNLYEWTISQKLQVNSFKWKNMCLNLLQRFIKKYNEHCHIGFILEIDVEYSKRLKNLHNDPPFLPERMLIDVSLFIIFMMKTTMLHL